MRSLTSITLVAFLALGVVACDDSSSEETVEGNDSATSQSGSVEDGDQVAVTTTGESTPSDSSVADTATSLRWELGSSLSGALGEVVSWSEGYAAIMDTDGDDVGSRGELWYSADGVEWEAALLRPFGRTDDIYALASQNDQLFALSGDILDDAVPQTLWSRRVGEPWEEVVTDDALEHIAVGSDRLIAYSQEGFEIVGVFDTATMDPVEFASLPDVEEQLGTPVYQGRAVALDEGFLATVGWLVGGPDQVDWRLLYSADGSTWTLHPTPPAGGLGVPYGQAVAPSFQGANLVASFSSVSGQPGAAWVTDTGMEFEPAAVPVVEELGGGDPMGTVEHTRGTDAGFLSVVEGITHRSFDGFDWDTIESPPTWSQLAGIDERGLVRGTVLATNDSLIAIGVHGEIEGFVGLVEPTTEIWVTER
jgi:hypothetical protein